MPMLAVSPQAMAAAEVVPQLTREDLREELQEFLQEVRHEVSHQVCQDLRAVSYGPLNMLDGTRDRSVASIGTRDRSVASIGRRASIRVSHVDSDRSRDMSPVRRQRSPMPRSVQQRPSLMLPIVIPPQPHSLKTSMAKSLLGHTSPRHTLKTNTAKSLLGDISEGLDSTYMSYRDVSADDDVGSNGAKQTSSSSLSDLKDFAAKESTREEDENENERESKVSNVSLVKGSTKSLVDIAETARKKTVTSHRPGGGDRGTYTLLVTGEVLRENSVETKERTSTLRGRLKKLVTNTYFEQGTYILVMANAASLGYDTQYWAEHRDNHASKLTVIAELIFCVAFSAELFLRICAFGKKFFLMESRWWNFLDMFLVALQIGEQLLRWVAQSKPMNVDILRLLRILRIMRVTRLVRTLHLFDDLRVIASSVVNSASSLFWSLLLLWLLMYMFSLVFLQMILAAGETEHAETINYWFGSLFRTYFTMFECIVGGVSWDEVAAPLMEDLGPFAGLLFGVYISIAVFAMMNLLTSVFVDKAMRTVRDDKDVVTAKRIRDLFLGSGEEANSPEDVTWDVFRTKLDSTALRDYFKQINVESTEAKYLFELLDTDNSGAISANEIVEGCLRLRGPARSLDLALVAKDVHELTVAVIEIKLLMLAMLEDWGWTQGGEDAEIHDI